MNLTINSLHPIPILIGITGHRDIDRKHIEKIKKGTLVALQSLLTNYSSSPIFLVTGLAEGADQDVANWALSLGIGIVGLLALPEQEFISDFSSNEHIQEFHKLLRISTLNLIAPPIGSSRPVCYENVGKWMTEYCPILIAIWDGNCVNPKPGGTADVVNSFLNQNLKTLGNDRLIPKNLVIHIKTPRISSPGFVPEDHIGEIAEIGKKLNDVSLADLIDSENSKQVQNQKRETLILSLERIVKNSVIVRNLKQ